MYRIEYSESAFGFLKAQRGFDRSLIVQQIENILRINPLLESKARVKRLRQPAPTDYRLRVADFRIFYNVDTHANRVDIVRILKKDAVADFMEEPL